jgi:hypothetical protein
MCASKGDGSCCQGNNGVLRLQGRWEQSSRGGS